ncbi:MAG: SRPBCC family protein [Pseudomonadota bacterium]
MSQPVIITHDYAASPADVWHVATDFACFAEAMKGVATFEGMPQTGALSAGDVFDVKVRLFGWLPPMDYHMQLAEFDPERHRFRSIESGGAIREWEHVLTVIPVDGGARLTDTVTIDAGLSTRLMRLWARFVYRRRHVPRIRMLARLRSKGQPA